MAAARGPQPRQLGPGDGYYIPSGVSHSFRVSPGHDLKYVEVFCPPKADNIL